MPWPMVGRVDVISHPPSEGLATGTLEVREDGTWDALDASGMLIGTGAWELSDTEQQMFFTTNLGESGSIFFQESSFIVGEGYKAAGLPCYPGPNQSVRNL
jgi:hypothetical protein